MFYSDEELERVRKKERIRRWLRPLTALAAVLAALIMGLAWLLTTPSGLAFLLEKATQGAPFDVSLGSLDLNPAEPQVETDRWRLVLEDLAITPHDPDRALIKVQRAELDAPGLRDILQIGEVDIGHVVIDGLTITTARQRPPPEWEARKTFIRAIRASELEVHSASYRAEPDAPLDVAAMKGIEARLQRVVWQPGNREISGTGSLKAASFQTGTLVLSDLDVSSLHVRHSDLHFQDGSFQYGGGAGTLAGDVLHFNRKAEATFEVGLTGARAEKMFQAATGRPSPLMAQVDGHLTVHSGGDLPRGGGWMSAQVRLTGGIFPLDEDERPIVRDILRLAPFMELDRDNRVILGDINGSLRFGRGSVLLHRLEYQAPRRILLLWGNMQSDGAQMVLRSVPPRDADRRGGFGIVAARMDGEEKFKFRIAKKADLLPELAEGESLGASLRRRMNEAP
ncbi:MAG: hypothetical protein KC912_05715 [Proteobacteria bacterium]|nr:hypothetical protein [Pseudomonadota bacterium]